MMYKDMERADFVDLMLSNDEGDTPESRLLAYKNQI